MIRRYVGSGAPRPALPAWGVTGASERDASEATSTVVAEVE
jgi:hypothetical protein